MKNRIIQQHTSAIRLLFGVIICAVMWAEAENKVKIGGISKEIQGIVTKYLKDSTGSYSFNENKSFLKIDPEVKLSDIEAGTPIPVYKVPYDTLLHGNISRPLKEFVEPISRWYVPIRAHGKYIYFLWIDRKHGTYGPLDVVGIIYGTPYNWDKLTHKWPENSGFKPVIIMAGGITEYVHFPQKDDYNLTRLGGSAKGSIDSKYESLSDSRVVLKNLRKQANERMKMHDKSLQKEDE